MATILFGLGQKGKQYIPLLFRHMITAHQSQRIGEVDHFRDRRRLFQRIISKRACNAGDLPVKLYARPWRSPGLPPRAPAGWGCPPQNIPTSPPDWIAQPPLLVAGEHHKRNALG